MKYVIILIILFLVGCKNNTQPNIETKHHFKNYTRSNVDLNSNVKYDIVYQEVDDVDMYIYIYLPEFTKENIEIVFENIKNLHLDVNLFFTFNDKKFSSSNCKSLLNDNMNSKNVFKVPKGTKECEATYAYKIGYAEIFDINIY